MKNLFTVLILFSSAASFACGSWTFRDSVSDHNISFLVHSIQLYSKDKADPRFIRNVKNKAYFTNGSRLKITNGKVELSSPLKIKNNKKRMFEKKLLGSYSDNTLNLTNYKPIKFELDSNIISVSQDSKLIGKGKIRILCDKSSILDQVKRLMSYYVWKSLKIDPFMEPTANWTW